MSKKETFADALEMPAAELNLGKVLALIQRVLPRLDEPDRATDVQSALGKAAAFLEAARQAHSQTAGVPVDSSSKGNIAPEIVAAIAAAISTVLATPYRLVSVQKVTVPVPPHANAWAVQGRTQIFMSHKVR